MTWDTTRDALDAAASDAHDDIMTAHDTARSSLVDATVADAAADIAWMASSITGTPEWNHPR